MNRVRLIHGAARSFAVTTLLFTSSALAAEHAREYAIGFCKDYDHEEPVTEKCINDQVATLPLIGCYERLYDAAHLVAQSLGVALSA
jgi:hypothetical protein